MLSADSHNPNMNFTDPISTFLTILDEKSFYTSYLQAVTDKMHCKHPELCLYFVAVWLHLNQLSKSKPTKYTCAKNTHTPEYILKHKTVVNNSRAEA